LHISSVSPHLARPSVSWDIDGTPGHAAIRPSPEAPGTSEVSRYPGRFSFPSRTPSWSQNGRAIGSIFNTSGRRRSQRSPRASNFRRQTCGPRYARNGKPPVVGVVYSATIESAAVADDGTNGQCEFAADSFCIKHTGSTNRTAQLPALPPRRCSATACRPRCTRSRRSLGGRASHFAVKPDSLMQHMVL
jgi:hypothetical protein